MKPPDLTSDPNQRFGCFVLHAHSVLDDGDRCVRLVLEDVGTGAKQRFSAPEELQRFLHEWGQSERQK